MIFKIIVNFFGKWISKTPLCNPLNISLDASLGEIIKGIGKLFFLSDAYLQIQGKPMKYQY